MTRDVLHCAACRALGGGIMHCAHPDECGGMQRVTIIDCAPDDRPTAGPDRCLLCTGEACALCGAGAWRSPLSDGVPCDHDIIERHTERHTERHLLLSPQ